jgi:hypothetical protein
MRLSELVWAQKLWEAIDTPVSLSCEILFRYGEYRQLVEKAISPSDYHNPLSFALDYQAVKALSKYPYLDTGIDRRKTAIGKFLEAEVQCLETNERFQKWYAHEKAFTPSHDVSEVFHLARRKIATILGDVPCFEDLDFKFGPGASFGVRGDTSVYKKLSSALECSYAFTPILQDFLHEFPGWIPDGVHSVFTVPGSELSFVPKDAKTDRPICIEPLLNGMYQKGFGSYIRKRLSRFGVNLRSQDVNQSLAQKAMDEGLCTVDFSSASDTISYMLVLDLLPIDWVIALDHARAPQYLAEGNWYNFHKFTSMGNGYTFELESLVFYALAVSSCSVLKIPYSTGDNLHVYGDDVILPKAAFDLFSRSCSFAGLTINQEKSFTSGVFYESCGSDWFTGTNVRPLLIKKRITSLLDMYYITNSTLAMCETFQRAADASGVPNPPCVDAIRDVHAWCISRIPRDKRFLIPRSVGDGGLHADFDIAKPSRPCKGMRFRGSNAETWCGYFYHSIQAIPDKIVPDFTVPYVLYCAWELVPFRLGEDPSPVHHSEGYSYRHSQPKLRKRTSFFGGDWDNLPVKWSERAITLVTLTKDRAPGR